MGIERIGRRMQTRTCRNEFTYVSGVAGFRFEGWFWAASSLLFPLLDLIVMDWKFFFGYNKDTGMSLIILN